jgi:mannosyltransferase
MTTPALTYDDVIFALQPRGGISGYWRNLTNSDVIKSNFKICRIKSELNHNFFMRQLLKIKACDTGDDDETIFHSSYYRLPKSKNVKTVLTVHDFTYKKYYSGIQKHVNNYQMSRAISQANEIICISHATKKDLLKFHPGISESKISVIYHGIDHQIFNRDQYQLKNKFSDCVLFVGSRSGYKNFTVAVDAISKSNSLRLGIVGNKLTDDELSLLKFKGVDYIDFGPISDSELSELYRHSHSLIYPSSYEGFGMPILEAMACGLPVLIGCDVASREISSENAIKCEEQNSSSFVKGFEKIEMNRSLLIENGILHAKKFQWETAAKKTAKIYRKLALNNKC